MNTNMTGFRVFIKIVCILVLWTKVASALEGLSDVLVGNVDFPGQQQCGDGPCLSSITCTMAHVITH